MIVRYEIECFLDLKASIPCNPRKVFHKILYGITCFLVYSSNLVGLATLPCILLLHCLSRKRAFQSGLLVNANCMSYVSLSSKVFLGLIYKSDEETIRSPVRLQ